MNYINTIFKRNATKALTLLVILLASVNAWAVDYIKPNGEVQSVAATTITSETTLLTNGWWAVNDNVTVNDRIEVDEEEGDDINIILCDGKTFTNVEGYSGINLIVWGQAEGTGTWNITQPSEDYPIGLHTDNITINGGIISAQAGEGSSYGIVGADNITINRGKVTAMPGIDSDNLTIREGAQLIHTNADMTATVQRHIDAYTSANDGWYFIASPITTSLTASEVSGLIPTGETIYDLYYLDEATTHWKNYKQTNFNIEPLKGYLYANSAGTDISFTGLLQPYVAEGVSVTLSKTDKGWNLKTQKMVIQ